MEEKEVKKVEDAEAVTLESLAAQVAEIMSFVQKLKPLEEAEHGALDEEIKTEDAEEVVEVKDESPKAEGMDAAEVKRQVIKEIAQRDSLYSKLSGVVGTFDHSEMGLNEVAVYGVKKLGIECAKGSEVATISGYLAGVSKAPIVTAMDSKKASSEIDVYLNGGK